MSLFYEKCEVAYSFVPVCQPVWTSVEKNRLVAIFWCSLKIQFRLKKRLLGLIIIIYNLIAKWYMYMYILIQIIKD